MGLGMGGPDWSERVRCKARESPFIRKTLQLFFTLRALHSLRLLSTFWAQEQPVPAPVDGPNFIETCMANPMPQCLPSHASFQ